jgi:hypothetical protein
MKTVISLILAVFLTIGLSAQTRPPQQQQRKSPEERAKATVEYLSSRMTLSQKKQDEMKTAYTTFFKETAEASDTHNPSKMETAKTDLDTRMKKILTEAEYKQVNQLLEERMKSRTKH